MNTIERLQNWHGGHKARTVSIEIGDGYGADCWSITLGHELGATSASEVAFVGPPNWETLVAEAKAKGHVFGQKDEDENGWPGLERTINAAIDAFEAGVWRK